MRRYTPAPRHAATTAAATAMSEHLPVILIELVLVFGGVLLFVVWQLRSVKRDQAKTRAERAAREAAAAAAAQTAGAAAEAAPGLPAPPSTSSPPPPPPPPPPAAQR
jgi:Flp pilus assembly protein protease CpaA